MDEILGLHFDLLWVDGLGWGGGCILQKDNNPNSLQRIKRNARMSLKKMHSRECVGVKYYINTGYTGYNWGNMFVP